MKVRHCKKLFLIIMSLCITSCLKAQHTSQINPIPFDFQLPTAVIIPEREVSLSDFGGSPDGNTLNTIAFEKAISFLSNQGGGHLIIPDGIWLTGPITMRSNIDLHLSDNAIILFSPDKSLYPIVPADRGTSSPLRTAPINANGQNNFSISGSGIIDGNGEAWRPVKRFKVSDAEWRTLEHLKLKEVKEGKSTVWFPTLGNKDGEIARKRPRLLRFIGCSNFTISGVTIQNSPSFHVNMILCQDFTLDGINVRCPWNAQNGDGIDLSSCHHALVENCCVDAGDDAICLKSGIGDIGRERGACSDIVIQGCTVYHGHGGFVIGSDTSGGMNNIYVNKCRFIDTDTGIRIKSGRDRGGLVTKVWIDDIVMCDIAEEAILFDCYYREKVGDASEIEPLPTTPDTPRFDGIDISHITCTDAERAIVIKGLPEMKVKNIEITNSVFNSRKGCVINYADNIKMKNITLNISSGERMTISHSTNSSIE